MVKIFPISFSVAAPHQAVPTINPVRTVRNFRRRAYFWVQLLALALLLSGTRAWAQVYPVNVSMQGDAPCSSIFAE